MRWDVLLFLHINWALKGNITVFFVPIPVNTIFSSAYLKCPKRIKILYSLAKFMPSSLYTNNPSRVDANKTHLLHLYSDGSPTLCSEPLCFDAMCY